jgi:selenocysteine lyase/cysteine desulfurase
VIALSERRGVTFDFYDATLHEAELVADIERRIKPTTTIIVATHQCNISSNVLPIEKIGALCKNHGIHFIVDASQSAGHLPIDVQRMNISALCMPGHKGLYGPMGVGVLIAGEGVQFDTLVEGGAGIASLERGMPEDLPDRLEAGTLPVPAIAGLAEGVRFVREAGMDTIHRHECTLADALVRGLREIRGVRLYGNTLGSNVSFTLDGHIPTEIGEYLSDHGICVRCGYHCAPVAHRTLGSYDRGSVRVSFSYMNKISEVERFLDVIRRI